MRIISKFRDYYDAVMKSGMDREVVYVRDQKEIVVNKQHELGYQYYRHTDDTIELFLLGYCGQIFKIAVVSSVSYQYRYVFHDFEEFKGFVLNNKVASEYDFRSRYWWPGKYAKFQDQDVSGLVKLFHEHQVPLFLLSSNEDGKNHKLTLNPSLKDFDFQTVKDPYTAYQDIFQYVAGVLNQRENNMVKISDKDKIHKHGFDKWSFRTMPGTKKKRKKRDKK